MNNILTQILCSFSLVLSVSFTGNTAFYDSAKLYSYNPQGITNALTASLAKGTNILYPASLQSHITESLEFVETFSNKQREYIINLYKKGASFYPKVVSVLERYNLPEELKVLIAMESGFNPNAVSSAGAVGYWQFMDGAAQEYGLQIADKKDAADPKSIKKDDRKNFTKSTLAAAKYLKDRCKELNNDLLLMVASYNCGAGNVRKAIKKSGITSPDFWDIKKFLPAETRNYVMKFIAMNVVFENYDKFINNKLVFNSEPADLLAIANVTKPNTSFNNQQLL